MQIITDPADLSEGDLFFGPIHGFVGAGVGLAQLVLATAEPGLIWRQGPKRWFRYRHTGIITKRATFGYELTPNGAHGIGPMLVQAMPGGTEEIELTQRQWNHEHVFIRPKYDASYPLIGQAASVAASARASVNTPYDFATYGAIPLYRRGVRTEAVKRIISDTSTMMCSRLVDQVLCENGYHLFDDQRLPGNVTPSELYRRVIEMPLAATSSWTLAIEARQ
jgi:hypothetical protein